MTVKKYVHYHFVHDNLFGVVNDVVVVDVNVVNIFDGDIVVVV